MMIYEEIQKEREYQIGKWGTNADDTINTPWMWASYIAQYATKWMAGTFSLNRDQSLNFRTCMVKVATLAIAAIESFDRQTADGGSAFYEAA